MGSVARHVLLPVVVLFACCAPQADAVVKTYTNLGTLLDSVEIQLDDDSDRVNITLVYDDLRWFGFGLGTAMAGTYSVIVGDDGTLYEYTLGDKVRGTALATPEFDEVEKSVVNGKRIVQLTRAGLAGSSVYNFDIMSTNIPTISAVWDPSLDFNVPHTTRKAGITAAVPLTPAPPTIAPTPAPPTIAPTPAPPTLAPTPAPPTLVPTLSPPTPAPPPTDPPATLPPLTLVPPTTVPTRAAAPSSDDDLSGGAIAGIVIACLVCCLLSVGALAFLLCRGKGKEKGLNISSDVDQSAPPPLEEQLLFEAQDGTVSVQQELAPQGHNGDTRSLLGEPHEGQMMQSSSAPQYQPPPPSQGADMDYARSGTAEQYPTSQPYQQQHFDIDEDDIEITEVPQAHPLHSGAAFPQRDTDAGPTFNREPAPIDDVQMAALGAPVTLRFDLPGVDHFSEDGFKGNIAQGMGLRRDQVEVLSVRNGSVIVEMRFRDVHNPKALNAKLVDAAVAKDPRTTLGKLFSVPYPLLEANIEGQPVRKPVKITPVSSLLSHSSVPDKRASQMSHMSQPNAALLGTKKLAAASNHCCCTKGCIHGNSHMLAPRSAAQAAQPLASAPIAVSIQPATATTSNMTSTPAPLPVNMMNTWGTPGPTPTPVQPLQAQPSPSFYVPLSASLAPTAEKTLHPTVHTLDGSPYRSASPVSYSAGVGTYPEKTLSGRTIESEMSQIRNLFERVAENQHALDAQESRRQASVRGGGYSYY